MEKAKINAWQLFSLIILFEFGTALVVGFGLDAKKDAWLAILVGLAFGLVIFLVYSYFYRIYPDLPLTNYARKILGKYIGLPIGVLYIVYFIYGAARDLRDASDLLITSIYDQTPMFVINALMIVSIAYVLHKGIEVLGRIAEIYLVIIVGLGILGTLTVLFSGIIDFKNLFPMLEKGWKPILMTAYSQTIIFPFGEMIAFTMVLPYLNKPQKALKTGISAMIISGVILSYTTLLNIAVLGVDIASRSTFPLFTTISKVNIAEFIQRVDAIVILTLIIGDFFKIAIFYYAAVMGAMDVFKIQQHYKLVFPIGIIVLYSSLMIASDFSEHIKEGKLALKTSHALFSVGIPLLLLVAFQIRKRFNPPQSDKIPNTK